jgi:hypothetical protein
MEVGPVRQEDKNGDAQPRSADKQSLSFGEECERLGIEVPASEAYGNSATVWFFGVPNASEDEETSKPKEQGSRSGSS